MILIIIIGVLQKNNKGNNTAKLKLTFSRIVSAWQVVQQGLFTERYLVSNRADQNGFLCGQSVAEEELLCSSNDLSTPKYTDNLQVKTFLFLNSAHGSQLIWTEMTKYQHWINQAIDVS